MEGDFDFTSLPMVVISPPHPLLHELHCQPRSTRWGPDPAPPGSLKQAILCNKSGNLTIDKSSSHTLAPPVLPIIRTPAPPGVEGRCYRTSRGFKNTKTPCKSSFASLPPEIRLRIYRLLLVTSESGIRYGICRRCAHMLVDQSHMGSHPLLYNQRDWYTRYQDTESGELIQPAWINWPKHWIYPAILGCSRLIYNEAMPVLYGENAFAVAPRNYNSIACHSWEISRVAMRMIKSVRTLSYSENRDLIHELGWYESRFPSLKELAVQTDVEYPDWITLINILKAYLPNFKLHKFSIMRLIEFEPNWNESKGKFYYQDFHSSYDDRPGVGEWDSHTNIYWTTSGNSDTILFVREDYIPPRPKHSPETGYLYVMPSYPEDGLDGVVRVTITTSEKTVMNCSPLLRDACKYAVPYDGVVYEEDTRPTAISGFKKLFNLPE